MCKVWETRATVTIEALFAAVTLLRPDCNCASNSDCYQITTKTRSGWKLMPHLLRKRIAISVVAFLFTTTNSPAFFLGDLWKMEPKHRAYYVVGVMDTLANDASGGPERYDFIMREFRNRNVMKWVVKKVESEPKLNGTSALLMFKLAVAELCSRAG